MRKLILKEYFLMDRYLFRKSQKTDGIDEKGMKNLRYFVRFGEVELWK